MKRTKKQRNPCGLAGYAAMRVGLLSFSVSAAVNRVLLFVLLMWNK
jgi:hypothetical protein